MGCTSSKSKCIRRKTPDAWSVFTRSPSKTTSSWSSGVLEIPSRLRNASDAHNPHPCTWRSEMGPMSVWMDISIDGEQQPRVIIDLLPHLAPRACENFRVLMRAQPGRGYRHTLFHEVSPGLHACAGLFTGESVFGGRFRDEICMEQPGYERYNVFMANTGPNSNNIEFFIALGENDFLDGQYVALGTITQGRSTIDTIEKAGVSVREDHVIRIENCGGTALPTDTNPNRPPTTRK